jgi:hypothetical protein
MAQRLLFQKRVEDGVLRADNPWWRASGSRMVAGRSRQLAFTGLPGRHAAFGEAGSQGGDGNVPSRGRTPSTTSKGDR